MDFMNKCALIHVENTENLVEFAKYLNESGWKILSANKTEEILKQEKIPVIKEQSLIENNLYFNDTSNLVKKILSTKIIDDDLNQTSEDQNKDNIFIICMNILPFMHFHLTDQKIKEICHPFSFLISTIIRNAFINSDNILILTDPADYKEAIIQLRTNNITKEFRRYIAAKALNMISSYDSGIASSILFQENAEGKFMNNLTFPFIKQFALHSGANPQQAACMYTFPINTGVANSIKKAKGKEVDYNIISDVSLAWEQISTLCLNLKTPYTVPSTNCDGYIFSTQFTPLTGIVFSIAVKHRSILGAALSSNAKDSFIKTYNYDSENIQNAVLAFSSVVDDQTAQEIIKSNITTIVAPDFTAEAKNIFETNKNILLIPAAKINSTPFNLQLINGGLLFQTKDSVIFDHWYIKTKNRPSQNITDQMIFGTMLTMGAKTYCSVLLKENQIVGISQGCKSSLSAVQSVLYEASLRNDEKIADVLICDTEISLSQSVKELIDKGLSAIIETGGSPDDEKLIQYCNDHNTVLIFTGKPHISY